MEAGEAEFHRWFFQHRPDALVLHEPTEDLHAMEAMLYHRGVRIPRDLGLVLTVARTSLKTAAGKTDTRSGWKSRPPAVHE